MAAPADAMPAESVEQVAPLAAEVLAALEGVWLPRALAGEKGATAQVLAIRRCRAELERREAQETSELDDGVLEVRVEFAEDWRAVRGGRSG